MSEQNEIEHSTNTMERPTESTSIEIDLSAVMGAVPVEKVATDTADVETTDAETTQVTEVSDVIAAESADAQGPTACLIQIHPVVGRCGVRYLGPATVIGREQTADVCIHSDSVSRNHAKIEQLTTGGYRLTDLDSTNGTFVNDVRVREWDIEPGDVVRCGGAILKVLPADDLEAKYHEVAYMMMTRDSLTGVSNRQFFEDALSRELARSARYGSTLCLLMMDLDHFKAVNDLHGHLAGDDVLREFARRTETILRNECIFARIGGEEFAIIVQQADLEHAKAVAERIRVATSSKKFRCGESQLAVSVSIGIAVTNGEEKLAIADFMKMADDSLYEAKRRGRDCVVVGGENDEQ